MLLLPYEKYNLYTRLSPEEVRQRIRTRLQLNDVVLVFCIIWLGIVGLCGILLPISEIRGALNGKRPIQKAPR